MNCGEPSAWIPDNRAVLKGYAESVDIYGAIDDEVVSVPHARARAVKGAGAWFRERPGGYND